MNITFYAHRVSAKRYRELVVLCSWLAKQQAAAEMYIRS